jgi:hypothetical protein
MPRRWAAVAACVALITASLWVATSAQSQQKAKQAGKGNKKKAAAPKIEQTQPTTPLVINEQQWPADDTVTVQIEFGLQDTEPMAWDGRLEVSGAQIIRLRPWRFGPAMTVDETTRSWKCSSWFGPPQAQRAFDRHLPSSPPPFVRPGVLIDLPSESARRAQLTIETPHGRFSLDVAKLASGRQYALNGRIAATRAVFGFPVAVRHELDERVWYDDPALAVSAGASDEVAVSYLAYSEETTSDAIYVRRRVDNKWQSPELVSEARGDHFRSALQYDGAENLWVVYAAQVEGNWDLYGRRRRGDKWQAAERLTIDPQPDMQHLLVRDREGGLWLVWQGFRKGQSDILARRWNGQAWSNERSLSSSSANDWHPSAAALPQRGIAVAWDSYESGNYDIFCRSTEDGGGPAVDCVRHGRALLG